MAYEATTHGKEQLRYLAGEDAKATYEQRQQVGVEVFGDAMDKQFLGKNIRDSKKDHPTG